MWRNRSFLVGPFAFVAGVVIASLSLSAPAPPAEKAPDRKTIDELQRERLAILKSLRNLVDQAFKNGECGFDKVHEARLAYLHAELEVYGTGPGRVARLKSIVDDAESWHDEVAKAIQNGQAGKADELKAKAYLLETRVALAKAQPAATEPRR
jgi:hypothetical protein